MTAILFSMTTIPQRAPHIAPVLGSLLAYPYSHIAITAPNDVLRLVPRINTERIHFFPVSTDWPDFPTNKWLANPDLVPAHCDIVCSCDDDFIYSCRDIKDLDRYLHNDYRTGQQFVNARDGIAYQARDAQNIFNDKFKPKAFTGFKDVRRTEQLYGGYLVAMARHTWILMRRSLLDQWDTLSQDEHLADDYTMARILTEMGVPIMALPIRPGFPGCYSAPYNSEGALSKRDGGNMARYMKLAAMHCEQGRKWWLACR